MSIEALMSAANAAGFAMIAEDDQFGISPDLAPRLGIDYGLGSESKDVALFQPSVSHTAMAHLKNSTAWHWIAGRFAGGAAA